MSGCLVTLSHSLFLGIHGFRLKVKGQYYPGMVHEVMDVLRSMNLEATDATIETDNVVCIVTLTCSTRNQNEDLDDEKFEDVRKHVFEALDDDEGQIVITPFKDWSANGQASKAGGAFYLPSYRIIHSKTGESERQKVEDSCQRERGHYVVIKVMSDHGPDFLQQIWKILNEQHLDVRKSKMYKNGNTSLKYFYTTDSESQNFEPTPERLQKLRDRLALEFKYHGVRAKALVKTVRIENAPSIYGFTPTVEAGEHVAEFNIYNEHHHEVLQKVLMMVADDYKFDIINSTTDMHGQTGYDHTTLFALDPNWEAQIPQDEITNRLISVFRNYNLTAQVSVHVYNVNADEETNEEEVKPVVASIDQSNTIRYRTLTSKASECPEPSCALSLRVDTNDNTRTGMACPLFSFEGVHGVKVVSEDPAPGLCQGSVKIFLRGKPIFGPFFGTQPPTSPRSSTSSQRDVNQKAVDREMTEQLAANFRWRWVIG